jgi:hypothetical protein
MRPHDKLHVNRTGMAVSPLLSASALRSARQAQPSAKGSAQNIARVRTEEARTAEPAGTVPPAASLRGTMTTLAKAMQGKKASIFIDKLGERLAFERSGTRLYDALISKYEAFGSWEGGPSLADLRQIREQERQHFLLLKQAVETLGGDPTAVTPSANLQAVASEGLPQVLTDPRTNLRDGLEVILIAELVDNDCWESLIDLSRALGNEDLSGSFEQALDQEREHLRQVRHWLAAALSQAATGRLSEPFAERETARARLEALPHGSNGRPRPNGHPRASNGRGKPRATGRRKPGSRRRSRSTPATRPTAGRKRH